MTKLIQSIFYKRCVLPCVIFISTFSNVRAQEVVYKESFDTENTAGVIGNCKSFDGYFDNVQVASDKISKLESFSISAWIAPQEYANNVAAIVEKELEFKSGFLFGINNYGKIVASVSVADKWVSLISDEAVPLLKWTYVTMSVENGKEISIYINGKKSGSLVIEGAINFCDSCSLSIGKTQTKTTPTFTERATSAYIKTNDLFYGLIDEVTIYNTSSNEQKVLSNFNTITLTNPQPLSFNQMPSGKSKPGKFGAYYTHLNYSKGWDKLWKGSDFPDIIVHFENTPIRYVFWRGTGYIPAVVNEKNMWMTDQSLEHWKTGECYEAMGDKQTRYSHVRIIENNAARVVIHWRYALAGIKHQFLPEDAYGWSDYADEYWTIYPDGIAARKQVLWSNRYETDKGSMQWQETIFFCQPGTRPQDNVDMKAITFMDMQGNKESYSWEDGPPKLKLFTSPKYQSIEYINFKAKYKPFSIFDEKRVCQPFSFGNMKEYTTFPNWNHWPVQQVASDGRNAIAPDKPSHSSLTGSNGKMQIVEKKSEGCYWASSLKGMTDQPIEDLMTLAKSWNYAPVMTTTNSNITATYDKYQRSYVVQSKTTFDKNLELKINASQENPLYNIPLIIKNWDSNKVNFKIDGKVISDVKTLKHDFIESENGTDLVVFITKTSLKPITILILKTNKK